MFHCLIIKDLCCSDSNQLIYFITELFVCQELFLIYFLKFFNFFAVLSVSNGTDCPVELPDALACMQCAVTRTTLRDHVGPYLPDQKFTVQEALDSYTIRSAEASFEENVKGQIAEGMMADFVVLGQNPFEVDESTIKDIPVCRTYLGGELVYEA